jgi:hypothetical protein
MCSEFENCTCFVVNLNIILICTGLFVSAGLSQSYQYLFESVHNCIIIGIDCVRSADTNNDFWYRLATTDTQKTAFFVSFKWYRSRGPIPKMACQLIPKMFFVVVGGYPRGFQARLRRG